MKFLARKGAKVYLGARTEEKGRQAVEELKAEGTGSGEVIWFSCSLNTPAEAKAAAEGFLQKETRLDILGAFMLNIIKLSTNLHGFSKQRRMVGHGRLVVFKNFVDIVPSPI